MKNIFKITTSALLTAILLFTCVFGSFADTRVSVLGESVAETKESKNNPGYTLPYRLYVPADYDPSKSYPVLLFLHGAGERGNDNESHVNATVQNLFNKRPDTLSQTIVICPQCPAGEQWVDYPWANGNYSTDSVKESKALSTAYEILESILDNFSCDKDRVYIMGLSMGGYGTWDMLVRHGDTFAAGVPLCGGGDPSKAEYLKDIPIWTYHGTADGTVKYEGTNEMYNAIVAAGGTKITFTSVENAGHNVWTEATCNAKLIDWLFAQRLYDRFPDSIADFEDVIKDTTTQEAPDNNDELGGCKSSAGVAFIPALMALGATVVLKKKKEQ